MKLQKKLAECNKKKINTPTKIEIASSNNSASSNVTAMLYNAIGHKVATEIAVDNILIFSSNREWNQQVSLLVQAAFAHVGMQAKIISTEKLSELKAYTCTQILFKITGINLGVHNFAVSIPKSAAAILKSLNLKEGKAISIGPLASLGAKEFYVVNSRNICKRVL